MMKGEGTMNYCKHYGKTAFWKYRLPENPIFVDMDGVVAVWDDIATVEETKVPGYWLKRELATAGKRLIDLFMKEEIPFCFLSSTWGVWSALEKDYWLTHRFGEEVPRIFLPCGENKAEYIGNRSGCILIDDYTKNLEAWEKSGNRGIKFMNEVNGSNGSWKGKRIEEDMTDEQILDIILTA